MENTTTGIHLTRSHDASLLAADIASALAEPVDDPFGQPLILVPGAATRRWLSQRIAQARAEGICAGVTFATFASLESLLTGEDEADDPWSPDALALRILELATEGAEGIEPLITHLSANDQRFANAHRVARLLNRYLRHRPEMLASWADGELPSLGFDTWQVHLWRHLKARVLTPDPSQRLARLSQGVESGLVGVPWPRIFVFAPRRVGQSDAALLAALATRVRVDAYAVTPRPGLASDLAPRLGRRGAADMAALADVASSQRVLSAPAARPSVEVHASHGLRRQVEVLREVLTGVFADDPTLEPRDVVVISPDVDAIAEHLEAAFPPLGTPQGNQHPASQLRLQVADRAAADVNQLRPLLKQVTELGDARATASELLSLCAHPFVARRFGFDADALERLEELAESASIRWGYDQAHRERHGLGTIRQGTWQAGVQRLLMGLALSEDSLAHVGVVAPVDDVASTDAALLGPLSELVSRVSRLANESRKPASAEVWVSRFRSALESLVEVTFDEEWQFAQVWRALERVERRITGSPVMLAAADALALLDAEFAEFPTRPAYGNGSLVVTSLRSLGQVPHKVVCLVGLGERDFPRRSIADGDDLMAADPRPSDPDPGGDDRQALLDALSACSDRFVVIYQGFSSLTNEEYHAPSGVIDIVEASGTEIISEPLQPHSPRNFAPDPRSFDSYALLAAQALADPQITDWNPYAIERVPLPEPPASLELDALRQFVTHPARYFLKNRARLSFWADDGLPEELPLELNGLGKWHIGQRILSDVASGHTMDASIAQAWLRGDVPPGELGKRVMNDIGAQVSGVLARRESFLTEPPEHHLIDLKLGATRLTGRAAARGSVTVTSQYGQVRAKHLAEAWVNALALTAQLERPVGAVLIGHKRVHQLTGVEPETARRLLSQLLSLAVEGLQRVLPMPPQVSQGWVKERLAGRDPLAWRSLEYTWKSDSDDVWARVLPRGSKPWGIDVQGEPWAQPGEPTLLGSLAAAVWGPIVRAER